MARVYVAWIVYVCLALRPGVRAEEPTVYELGSRLELFVDQRQIERMEGVRLVLHRPEPREIALATDAPWEGGWSAYFTVMADGETYRMYYRGQPMIGAREEVTCYAESKDGIHWVKPVVGLFEHEGSKQNNIVWKGAPQGTTHNFTPFVDRRPGVPVDERYKALAGGPLYAFASADGIRWRLLSETPVLARGAFDSQNLAFWDTQRKLYVCYFRIFVDGVRHIATATSEDFLHWSDPQPLELAPGPQEHLYTNAITPYFRAPHYYFSFPKRFAPERKKLPEHPEPGISEGVFMSSRDGLHFDRTFLEAFIRPGLDPLNWGDRSCMTAWGLLQTGPAEMSLYYTQHYEFPTHHLRRGVLRLDGLVSASAGRAGGELITRPLRMSGKQLVLNYSTAATGSVQVEIQTAAGEPISGFTLAEAPELYGDSVAEAYAWSGGTDTSALDGQPIRLRFVLRDADLFSYRFAEQP